MNLRLNTSVALIFTTFLSGCAATKHQSVEGTLSNSLPEVATEWAAVSSRLVGEPVAWIEKLEDPALTVIVREGQAHNSTLLGARARIERARGLARLAGSALSPHVSGSTSNAVAGVLDGGDTAQYQIGLSVNWEVDLWGRLNARRNAAEQSLAAVEADYRGASNLLAASIARSYFLVAEASEQERIADDVLSTLIELERIIGARAEHGLATRQDVALSKSDIATARETLAEIRGAHRNALRALEVLIGRYPSIHGDIHPVLANSPDLPPTGLPSDLLERRPDLIASERRVAARLYALNEARTAKLPSLNLSASSGGASSDLSNVLAPENIAWRTAGSLLAPLLNGGALAAGEDIASADVQSAVAAYAETALTAFSEVETALDQSVVLRERADFLMLAQDESQMAFNTAKARYESGETDLIDVLAIQQRLFSARSERFNVKRAQLDNYIALSLALGGDWE